MKIRQARSLKGESNNDKAERARLPAYDAELGQKKDQKKKLEKSLQDELKMKASEDASLITLETELSILEDISRKLGVGSAPPQWESKYGLTD